MEPPKRYLFKMALEEITRQNLRKIQEVATQSHFSGFYPDRTSFFTKSKKPTVWSTTRDRSLAFRIRSGHCGLATHLNQIGVLETPNCRLCDSPQESLHHLIFKCKKLSSTNNMHAKALRSSGWTSIVTGIEKEDNYILNLLIVFAKGLQSQQLFI